MTGADSARNHIYRDHRLEVDLEVSDVMFLAANVIDTSPSRMHDLARLLRKRRGEEERVWSQWRRKREPVRVESGDGSALKPHRPWQMLTRSVFHVELSDEDAVTRDYAVDVKYFSWDGTVDFYVDDRQQLVSEQPTAFPVPGGVIEVAVGASGLRRIHLVRDDGSPERTLTPVRHSAEYWRAVIDHRHPALSRWIGRAAIAILLLGLVLFGPQLLQAVSEWHVVGDRVGTYTSPITLPDWLNTTLLIAGAAASLERALTLRSHWLIDLKPWFLG